MIVEAAAYQGDKEVIPVYIFDPRYFSTTEFGSFRTGIFRSRFLVESVMALREELKGLMSGLIVGIGRAEDLLPKLVAREDLLELGFSSKMVKNIGDAQLKATTLIWQEQVTPEELDIDERVRRIQTMNGIHSPIHSPMSTLSHQHTLQQALHHQSPTSNPFEARLTMRAPRRAPPATPQAPPLQPPQPPPLQPHSPRIRSHRPHCQHIPFCLLRG